MPRTKPQGCQGCLAVSRPNYVATSGFVPADPWQTTDLSAIKFAIMAESAGEQEVIQERPLCGDTGIELHSRILGPLGVERRHVLFDNVIRCKPKDNRLPDAWAADQMATHCRRWDFMIDAFDPTVVILAFHPTFALMRTNQAYSTMNAVRKALRLYDRGERPLIGMGGLFKETFFPSLPGSVTQWDGKHFYIQWKPLSAYIMPGHKGFVAAVEDRVDTPILTLS